MVRVGVLKIACHDEQDSTTKVAEELHLSLPTLLISYIYCLENMTSNQREGLELELISTVPSQPTTRFFKDLIPF